MLRRALLVLLLAAAPLARADVTQPKASRPQKKRPRCKIRPLKLVSRSAHGTMPLLVLDAAGGLKVTLGNLQAKLDPRGCLIGPDGIWTELGAGGTLWLPHERIETRGAALLLPGGASLRIGKDGAIERVEADGKVAPSPDGGLAIEGYGEDVQCTSLLMLGAFMSMMPSMAVSDGHPRAEPPLADGPCRKR